MICKCGCGLETNATCGFYKGHWNKGRKRLDLRERNLNDNPMKNPKIAKKAGIKPKGFVTWNKGLTLETDTRVKNIAEKRNKNIKKIAQKISKTKKEKYKTGELVSYWGGRDRSSDKKFIEKMRISTINRIVRQGKIISYNENSIKFFDIINEAYNLEGLYGKNEFKCLGYSLDFYSKKFNLVIEWDEEHHYKNNNLLPKDIERQENIIKHLNCSFIRIRETKKDEFDFNIIKNLIK